ncbi:hypothetical protein LUZ60_008481 [Juncus effusus]|nr:hypothetical protein LUZ60_008481 [Juncus effusus]
MGSLENGALPLSKRDYNPLLRPSASSSSSLRTRNCRSRLARFLLFEKVDHFHVLSIAGLFFFVVFLFGLFLPGSVPDRPVTHADDQVTEVSGLGLDFGEGIRFEPVKLIESWEKERREEKESLSALETRVLRVGVRRPRLAVVFGDLLLDEMQVKMISVGAALKEAGYDIEVFSFEGGPAGTIWRSLAIPVHNLSINTGRFSSIDWLDFNGILVNSLLSRPIFSILMQEPFKSVPVIWTIHESQLAVRLNDYVSDGLTQLIHEWNRTFNRASVVVFQNHILPLMYSQFDSGNFYVIPGSASEVLKAEKLLNNHDNIHDMRQNYGFAPDDFIITIVGSQFWYSGVLVEHALVLKALFPLLQQFPSKNSSNSRLKIQILSTNSSEPYKTAIETIALKVGFQSGVVGHFGNFDKAENVLSISDIVIYGSFLEEQAFPSILIQSMSLNKLIFASNLSMITKYVENGVNGYIYPQENMGALTKIISQTLSEGQISLFAKRVALIGQNHAKNLLASQTIQGYIDLLENVIRFPSETRKPNPGIGIPDKLRNQWQWGLVGDFREAVYLEERVLGEVEKEKGQSGNFSSKGDYEALAAVDWEEEKRIEMATIKRRLEEEELKERSEQAHGTWEEVYRNAKRADRAKNELHERDDRELERTGQPLCIYEPYFGEGAWNFLHHSSLYRGIGLGTRGRRPGLDDIDASSRLPLLNDIYYRNLLNEFGAFFAIANRIDRVHKNAWIGFQSWRATAKQGSLSKDAELAILNDIEEQKHGDALYFWVRMDQESRNLSKLDFWSFCDSINSGNCRYVVKKVLRRMYNIKEEDIKDILPSMHSENGEIWSVMQSWVLPTRSFLEFVMFSRMFVDALDAEMYESHHETGHCYLSTHKDPHCYSRVLELLINIWAYHSARRMVYVDPKTGSMQEIHHLNTRKNQMMIQWFSFQTLKSMDEDLAEEFDLDGSESKRWIWPKTGEVYWQGVLERERNLRQREKERKKQQSKDKIERIKKRARQKTLGKFIKPPPEENNSTSTD